MQYPVVVKLMIVGRNVRLLKKILLPAPPREGERVAITDMLCVMRVCIAEIVYEYSEENGGTYYTVASGWLEFHERKPASIDDEDVEELLAAGWQSEEGILRKHISEEYREPDEIVFFET